MVTEAPRPVRDAGNRVAVWRAPDGRRVAVWPLHHGLLNAFTAFVRRLAPDSRARRFLAPLQDLSDEAVRRLVVVDQRGNVAWIAEEFARPGVIVADARYSVTAAGEAELALAVADDWQKSGLGSYLLGRLLEHAAGRGIGCAWGHVRCDNLAALALASRFLFDVRPDPGEPGLLMVVRALARGLLAGTGFSEPLARGT